MRLLVPFAAGGGADVISRPFVDKLSERLGRPIIYENRGGAGGVLAGEIVARAVPDGYTLLLGAVSVMTVTVNLMKIPFDPVQDFAPITKIADVASLLAARAGVRPAHAEGDRRLREGQSGQAHLGRIRHRLGGTPRDGALQARAGHQRRRRCSTRARVPAPSRCSATKPTSCRRIPASSWRHIKAGRLRPIAVSSEKRISILPGPSDVRRDGFSRLHPRLVVRPARAGEHTRGDHQAAARGERESAARTRDCSRASPATAAMPGGNTPQAFAQEIRSEIAASAKVIKAANIKVQ